MRRILSFIASKHKNKREPAVSDIGKQESRPSGGQGPAKSPGPADGKTRPSFNIRYDWIFVGLVLVLVVIVRTRLLGFPLERDEGEYAYLGQLIQHGIPPYGTAYNMKLPGTYFMYALIMSLFGQTITGIHLGLMVTNCVTILLIYKVGAKMVGSLAGAVAACAYGVLSLDSSVLGFAGHATHFVVFWAMAGLLVLLYALEKDRLPLYFAAGVLLCLAFIMKQPGVFFVMFGAAHIIIHGLGGSTAKTRMLPGLGFFLDGVLSTLFVMIGYLYAAGVLERFWFFTFVYSFKYGTQIPLSAAAYSFIVHFPGVLDGFFLIWVFAALGLVALFLHPGLKHRRLPISLFAACSFLTVCPGFYFRPHYFITLLPAVALSAGILVDYVCMRTVQAIGSSVPVSRKALSWCVALAVFAPAVVVGAMHHGGYLFEEDPVRLCRKIYGANPFPESVEVARFIEGRTAKTDTVAVLGSEAQIYFYSRRRSATGYIYTYSLMEIHAYSLTMQREMAGEIERARPKFIVLVNVTASWLARRGSDRFIFQWADAYLRKHYNPAGIVDIFPGTTMYRWNEDARGNSPMSPTSLLVFRRR